MDASVEDIARKLDALGLWETAAPYHWAVKPRGCAFPYFVCILKGEVPALKARLLLLEGWQTFHDFVRTRIDNSYGFWSSPIEFPHFELVTLADGEAKLFRHDPGYLPVEANGSQRALCTRLLWEVYGVFFRLEGNPGLPLSYSDEKAVFARVETAPGAWEDRPLAIPDARPHVEKVTFAKPDLAKAKDLPLVADFAVEADFRLLAGLMTCEKRPRCAYALAAVNAKTGERLFFDRVSAAPESGLRGLWEGMPPQFLRHLIALGRLPAEVRLASPRVFRLLRPLCLELPFKLSLHDRLPRVDAAFAGPGDAVRPI